MIQTSSNNNEVFRNIIDSNKVYGLFVGYSSSNNSIYNNNITRNAIGIFLNQSTTNSFVHNNIVDNNHQVTTYESMLDRWDTGFDGNFWSDYNGTDENQDGIGDISYIIDANNTDHFPLMSPYPIPEFPLFFIVPLFFIATLIGVVVYGKRTGKKLRLCAQNL